jgi:hypothetical protein
MKSLLLASVLSLVAAPAFARGAQPEDLLQGKLIISDQALPLSWNSVGAYVAKLKGMNKGTIWYDKKTGKVTLQYAAFFGKPVNDVQVELKIYDITDGRRDFKNSTENFIRRGDRVLFNSATFDKEDYPMNRKYRITVESRGQILATGDIILRGEGEKFSGKVTFTDDETKEKKQ